MADPVGNLPDLLATEESRRIAAEAERDRLRAVADAAELIRVYDQAGGNEWWEAHAKLYLALDALESGPEGGEGG